MPDPKETTRILLVDDDEDDVILFRRIVDKIPHAAFDIEWIPNYDDAHTAIAREDHDVYLIDYRLGAHSGTELLRDFEATQRKQPFIMLTGAADGELEQEALQLGASDYLVKGSFDEQLLGRVVQYSIQRKVMEAQRIEHLLEVNRSKDEFIAVASHELRTPATAVKQYVSMVLEGFAGDISDSQKNFLKRAYDSNERQLQIIDDILRVARLDLDKLSLNLVDIDVCGLIKAVVRDATPVATKRMQKIIYEEAKQACVVRGDELYLRMALANIIDNASKYSEEGKSIEVVAEQRDDMVSVSVTDEGVGIAKADLEKLFVKFSRIHNPLSIQRGGTGLGLYWSKEIIELHGGDITVESEDGKGTTFTICLPNKDQKKAA